MNEHDSESIAGLLRDCGYDFTGEPESADLIIYNTCCVRENPERKVYGQVGLLSRLKQEKPGLLVAVCGCMAQRPHEAQKIALRLPHVDLVFGTHNIHRLPVLLEQVRQTRERVVEVWHEEGDVVEGLPVIRESPIKAYVTVIYGCTNFCSYCIVPFVRGKERSRKPGAVVGEVERLAADGVKEVMLLGQNVNSYGKDLEEKTDFAQLLRLLRQIPGIRRIRFTTSHPKDVSDELIEIMAEPGKVCEHLHLPVQAGSDRVLWLMKRGYTRKGYEALVSRIREAVAGLALTTDIIVGFPGETEKDFNETLELVESVGFDSAFTFIFAPRPGTPAEHLPGQVAEEVKRDRIYRLIEVQNRVSNRINQALIGTTVPVLVEGTSDKHHGVLMGRTRTNKVVAFTGRPLPPGKEVEVRLTKAQTWTLFGEAVSSGAASN